MEVLKALQSQTPTGQLIPSSYTQLYLAPYMSNANALDNYYLGIKYKTLEFAGDTIEDLSGLISTALSIYNYKWDKLYKSLSLAYDPIANVDAEIIETRDIAQKHYEDTYGAQEGDATSGQAPYDTDEMRNVAKTKSTSEEYTNEHDEDAYIDTITTTRKGNIGVTSSQSLVLEERRVAEFKYLDIVFKDIMDVIAMPYFT